jgi:hypothetical protein
MNLSLFTSTSNPYVDDQNKCCLIASREKNRFPQANVNFVLCDLFVLLPMSWFPKMRKQRDAHFSVASK